MSESVLMETRINFGHRTEFVHQYRLNLKVRSNFCDSVFCETTKSPKTTIDPFQCASNMEGEAVVRLKQNLRYRPQSGTGQNNTAALIMVDLVKTECCCASRRYFYPDQVWIKAYFAETIHNLTPLKLEQQFTSISHLYRTFFLRMSRKRPFIIWFQFKTVSQVFKWLSCWIFFFFNI